jgi:tripartite-type tricarboxylate transporter receptor subunit TctC
MPKQELLPKQESLPKQTLEETMRRTPAVAAALLVALMLAPPTDAQAQAWPSRTVTIVVPFPPGGGVDVLARIAA